MTERGGARASWPVLLFGLARKKPESFLDKRL